MNEITSSEPCYDDNPLQWWRAFGFDVEEVPPVGIDIQCKLPEGVIVFEGKANLPDTLKRLPVPPKLLTQRGERHYAFYRITPDFTLPDDLKAAVKIRTAGDTLNLANGPDFRPDDYIAKRIEDLTLLEGTIAPPSSVVIGGPLAPYSVRGQAEEFKRKAIDARPLLAQLCFAGESTVWFAPPNAGKTLIGLNLVIEAISSGRIDPGNVYYINADDSSTGLASKLRLMDDLGVHTLIPGHKGFRTDMPRPICAPTPISRRSSGCTCCHAGERCGSRISRRRTLHSGLPRSGRAAWHRQRSRSCV